MSLKSTTEVRVGNPIFLIASAGCSFRLTLDAHQFLEVELVHMNVSKSRDLDNGLHLL